MNTHVLFAVFRRNFVSYFANPTGYVFICLFVLLGAIAAFWVPDFFNNNLANLDQLSFWFPFIMLVYIPTITMGIWAEERKQGTDELLLTIPAADFDIVLGKYLAALAIFTVSLLFSLVCNYLVLDNLASTSSAADVGPRTSLGLDTGLFIGTYVGYWLVGLAMLGIGLVASFLTSNITIGFVLGVIFNMPLVFLARADAVFGAFGQENLMAVKQWSISQQMHDFSRGMLTLAGFAYFLMILTVMLYASIILIGRRHWKVGILMPSRRVVFFLIALLAATPALPRIAFLITQNPVCLKPYFPGSGYFFYALFPLFWLIWGGIAIAIFVVVALVQWPWEGQRNSFHMLAHYTLRILALIVIALGIVVVFRHHDVRFDVTAEQLSSLSPQTRTLIENLKKEPPVQIEAFISPNVPEEYVQTRLNLLTILEELRALGGSKLQVKIHDTANLSDEAAYAEKRYGIEPRQVTTLNRGVYSVDQVFLNVAVTCGNTKPPPPMFIDRDTPAEYELVRSICTVTEQKRKTLGILNTDAQLFGSFNMQTMSPSPNWPIIDELEKQYNVVRVDPSKPITEKYDVLLAVQPSTLGPQETDNFIAAIVAGQPTAIFEDPAPLLAGIAASSMPRQSPGGMNPMMRQPAPPKGNIGRLWNLLGIDFPNAKIAWQDFNPYPKIPDFTRNREFVFVDAAAGANEPFSPVDSISSGLQQVLFPFPGFLVRQYTADPKLTFTPLVMTGNKTGTVGYRDLMQMSPFGTPGGLNPNRPLVPTGACYILSAHVQGKIDLPTTIEEPFKKGGQKPAEKKPTVGNINVVVTTDVDMLSQAFFILREQGDQPSIGVHFRFDNVTFVLNILDVLAGDNRFVEIRKRRPAHRILARIEEKTKDAKKMAADSREELSKEFDKQEQVRQKRIEDKLAELKSQKNQDLQQMLIQVEMVTRDLERQKEGELEQLRRKKVRDEKQIETELQKAVGNVQFRYKLWAVLLPPIPPLLVGLIVFFTRRAKEREGVAKSRLR